LPREVFFFGFGLPVGSLPAAAARAFCFFVAKDPPIVAGTHRTRFSPGWEHMAHAVLSQ